ncbi:hypothetical protein [Tenacibaculum halocynthiae]|uniref:hypothetical protein n=1 Tax=Tenacibaculum halocynthiae TaxID=1254437 RepID=UPI003895C06E
MFRFKKHIIFLSLLVLLLPSVIQCIHAFENHEHIICSSIDEHHFHEQEIDCSILHFQVGVTTYDYPFDYQIISEEIYNPQFNQPLTVTLHNTNKKTPRGPPFVI